MNILMLRAFLKKVNVLSYLLVTAVKASLTNFILISTKKYFSKIILHVISAKSNYHANSS